MTYLTIAGANFETEQGSTVQKGCVQSSRPSRQHEEADSFLTEWKACEH